MLKLSNIFLLLSLLLLNNVFSQNVASESVIHIDWVKSTANSRPLSYNFSLSSHQFNGVKLPAIAQNFKSNSRATFVFTDLKYELLDGFEDFKTNFLKNLKGSPEPVIWYSYEGSQLYSGFYICPFKEEAGRYYKLVDFKYSMQAGLVVPLSNTISKKRAVSNSALASGKWLKFSVTKDGFYKIDGATLQNAGLDLNTVNPKNLKVYSHQGGMLPEDNSAFRHDDLPENSIIVVGENDGVFNASDYILFYAQAPHKWKYNSANSTYAHQTNIYSDKTFFFITANGAPGKRISNKADGNNLVADSSFNWFNYFEFHEDEKENICHQGRTLLGEKFDQTLSYSFNHNLPNISGNLPLLVKYQVGAVSAVSSNVILKANTNTTDVTSLSALFNPDACFVESGIKTLQVPFSSNLQLQFSYNKPISSSKAWLDYYEIHCSRNLSYSESFMGFRNINSRTSTVSEYRLNNLPNSAQIFDVSDPLNPQLQNVFSLNSEMVFRDQPQGKIKEFALTDGNYLSPVFEEQVGNQDLHGLGNFQFIIVSAPEFIDAANDLAAWHRTRDNLEVLVVTPQQIYNEFSSGSQDISAIRDFFSLFYYKNTNPLNQLRYAMFMGDASYDYKNKLGFKSSFIPVYESDEKMNIPLYENYYCSDDFFGYLDPLDGKWEDEQKLEIAVTRLPVASVAEANNMVEKIKHYKDKESLGAWRNVVTLAADDADLDWEKDFVFDFETMSRNIDTTFKNLNVRKVYFDAFKQENLSGSQRYPEAQAAIKKEFEQGTLIFNYVGHGGEEYLASEKVIDIPLVTSLKNSNNLPVFFTATCSFSRYDDAMQKSAGEYVITQPNGGAIAMFTTVRIVYAGANADITRYFWSNCAYVKQNGKWPTLGEVYKKLKNGGGQNSNDRRFTLFADPALVMNYPEHIVKIDSINSSGVSSKSDTLKALSKVTFVGHIEDVFGAKQTGFNGTIFPIVYDKQSTFNTLSNDLPSQEIPFKLYSSVLYKGENSVVNGDYRFSFVVPKDINYNYGYGKISLYAENQVTDATGHYLDFMVGGTSNSSTQDVKGPEIELFVDDYSFVSGGLTDNSPLLLARVYDENGINTSGIGIGRDIIAIIDKGTAQEKRFVLNSFYSAKLNSYTTGDIRYQLEGIADGKHTYTLKVWDVYNNSNEATIEFVIKNNAQFTIQHVYNYPNPFNNNTSFLFDHNRSGDNLHVVITVMTISGKVIKTIDENFSNAEAHISGIQWNGRDDYDDKPAKGVYIYRIVVTTEDGQKAEKVEKLVILN